MIKSDKQEVKDIKNTDCETKSATSLLDDLLVKLSNLPNVNIDSIKPKGNPNVEDIETVLSNLNKSGLRVKRLQDSIKQNGKTFKKRTPKEEGHSQNEKELISCNIIEALEFLNSDSENESDYEIEALEDDSDFEEFNSSKNKQRASDETRKSKVAKISSRDSEFVKIRSTNFMCIMCLNKFPSLKLLTEHMNSPEPCTSTILPCSVCGKEFSSKSRLTAHLQIHKEKPKYFCDKCGQSFGNMNKLAIHLEFMHTEYFDAVGEKFQCKLCGHEALSRDLVLQHVNTAHYHVSTYLCHICGKSFMNEIRLKVHIMTHRETRSFLCQICSKAFKTPPSLQAHIRTHNQEKKFVCDECGKAFKKGSTLRDHKKCHASDSSYCCQICDKHFISKSSLSVHLKNHL